MQDKSGALILPLISITRSSLENTPQKGVSNNQMFPHVIKKRLSKKDLEYRQNKNHEGLDNTLNLNEKTGEKDFLLNQVLQKNIQN